MKSQVLNQFKKLGSDFRGLPRLWPFLKGQKNLLFWACILIPMISILQTSVPFLLKWTIDHGILTHDLNVLTKGAAAYFLVLCLEYGARAMQTILTSRAVFHMIRTMRMQLVGHIMSLSARYHDRTLSGTLVTRATSDFDNLSESLNQGVLSSVVDLAVLIGALVGLFLLNWRLALIALLILPIVVTIIILFSRALKRSMLLARVKIAALNAYTQECLYGHSTIKLLNAQKDTYQRFDHMALEYRDAQMKSVVVDAILFALLDGVASITIGLVLWVAVRRLGLDANLSAGVMVAFVQYIQNLFDPLKQLGNKIAMLQGAFTALDRVFGVFDAQDFVKGEQQPQGIQGNIRFQNVSFSYRSEGTDLKVLKNLSFAVTAGHSLAIVGATGSGKSTLVKLLSKMYDGFEGDIIVDGQNLRELSGHALRRLLAIVPQDIVIFEGTVAFNIGLGDPSMSRERIAEAAQFVGLDRFLDQLPGGLDFGLREGGDNISQGQRQLIVFARAVVRDPRIIILDEATSSVDPAAEAAIQQAIDKLFSGRSLVVIAHRLSTIRRCDQIMVLEKGQLLEMGRHETLMQNKGAYFALHEKLAESHEL